jgi:hypothetical protein
VKFTRSMTHTFQVSHFVAFSPFLAQYSHHLCLVLMHHYSKKQSDNHLFPSPTSNYQSASCLYGSTYSGYFHTMKSQYTPLALAFPSISIMLSALTYLVARARMSFFLWPYNIPLCEFFCIFIHLLTGI